MHKRKATKKKAAPAFQFYVGDFLTGTITMSLAEVGGYIRLLGLQWSAGSVPGDDPAALARAMGCDRSEAESVWLKIRDKFRCKKEGVWINSRLEKERKKQAAFRKLQKEKGKKGGRPKAAAKPGVSREQSPDEALQSSSSHFGDQKQVHPPTPATAGGVVVTREDRKEAKTIRGNRPCDHEPHCETYSICIEHIAVWIATKRAEARKAS